MKPEMTKNIESMKNVDGNPSVTPERLMQFAFAYAPPLLVKAGVEHRVFDVLSEGPRTVAEVSEAAGASERGLRATMNALAGLNLLAKDEAGRYALTPESDAFLVSGRPGYRGDFFRHVGGSLMPRWLELDEVVRSGKPARDMNREQEGAQFFRGFVESLFPNCYPAARVLAGALGVREAEGGVRVLDLAAGSGVWGIALTEDAPKVRVTAFDWPDVIPVTRRMAARHGVEDRFSFVEGDLQTADFGEGYDVITLGHILHMEGAGRNRELLRKVFAALTPGGTVVIADWLVNDERTAPLPALIFAVNMLVHTDSGDTFTFGEFSEWLREAGFERPRLLEVPGPSPLILATKPKA